LEACGDSGAPIASQSGNQFMGIHIASNSNDKEEPERRVYYTKHQNYESLFPNIIWGLLP